MDSSLNFEAVVVGTGFGGATTACRLARAWPGKVMVLERGRRYPAGSFLRSDRFLRENLWNVAGETRKRFLPVRGDSRGPFDTLRFDHLDAVVAAGFGGGSLLYGNALKEPQFEAVYARWPETLGLAHMKPYFDVVKDVLEARTLPPAAGDPRRRIRRVDVYRDAAFNLGQTTGLIELAIAFGPDRASLSPPGTPHVNAHGAPQRSCTYCGQCILGCNVGAKNTLDVNYLRVAEQVHGAKVVTEARCEVVVPLDAGGADSPTSDGRHGYRVYFRDLTTGQPVSRTAQRVILAAGSLATTELLLRNREVHRTLPGLSAALGAGMSANGDFLGFVVGGPPDADSTYGPTLVDWIHHRDAKREIFVEQFVIPRDMVRWVLASLAPSHPRARRPFLALVDTLSRQQRRVQALLLQHSDSSTGKGALDGQGHLGIRWPAHEQRGMDEFAIEVITQYRRAVGGSFDFIVPTWRAPLRRNFTVHPLGGAAAAVTPRDGVVSADPSTFGQAFGYRGLFVADGATVPAAVGVNPALVIGAMGERVAAGILGRSPTPTLL